MGRFTPEEYNEMINKYSIEYHSKLDEQKSICVKNGYDYDITQCKKIKEEIGSIKRKFKDITKDIADNINIYSDNIIKVDKQVEDYSKQNNKLKAKLDQSLDSEAGAQGLLVDTVYLYNQQLLGNCILFGVMIFLCYYNRVSFRQVKEQAGSIAVNVKDKFSDVATKLGKR